MSHSAELSTQRHALSAAKRAFEARADVTSAQNTEVITLLRGMQEQFAALAALLTQQQSRSRPSQPRARPSAVPRRIEIDVDADDEPRAPPVPPRARTSAVPRRVEIDADADDETDVHSSLDDRTHVPSQIIDIDDYVTDSDDESKGNAIRRWTQVERRLQRDQRMTGAFAAARLTPENFSVMWEKKLFPPYPQRMPYKDRTGRMHHEALCSLHSHLRGLIAERASTSSIYEAHLDLQRAIHQAYRHLLSIHRTPAPGWQAFDSELRKSVVSNRRALSTHKFTALDDIFEKVTDKYRPKQQGEAQKGRHSQAPNSRGRGGRGRGGRGSFRSNSTRSNLSLVQSDNDN
jgi:hypothetical protein